MLLLKSYMSSNKNIDKDTQRNEEFLRVFCELKTQLSYLLCPVPWPEWPDQREVFQQLLCWQRWRWWRWWWSDPGWGSYQPSEQWRWQPPPHTEQSRPCWWWLRWGGWTWISSGPPCSPAPDCWQWPGELLSCWLYQMLWPELVPSYQWTWIIVT